MKFPTEPILQDPSVSNTLQVLPSEAALGLCLSQVRVHGFRHLLLSIKMSFGQHIPRTGKLMPLESKSKPAIIKSVSGVLGMCWWGHLSLLLS